MKTRASVTPCRRPASARRVEAAVRSGDPRRVLSAVTEARGGCAFSPSAVSDDTASVLVDVLRTMALSPFCVRVVLDSLPAGAIDVKTAVAILIKQRNNMTPDDAVDALLDTDAGRAAFGATLRAAGGCGGASRACYQYTYNFRDAFGRLIADNDWDMIGAMLRRLGNPGQGDRQGETLIPGAKAVAGALAEEAAGAVTGTNLVPEVEPAAAWGEMGRCSAALASGTANPSPDSPTRKRVTWSLKLEHVKEIPAREPKVRARATAAASGGVAPTLMGPPASRKRPRSADIAPHKSLTIDLAACQLLGVADDDDTDDGSASSSSGSGDVRAGWSLPRGRDHDDDCDLDAYISCHLKDLEHLSSEEEVWRSPRIDSSAVAALPGPAGCSAMSRAIWGM